MFSIQANGNGSAGNSTDGLQDADDTTEFTRSGVDEVDSGKESSVSSHLSHLSNCQREAMAPVKSAGSLLVDRNSSTALHNPAFGLETTVNVGD